MKVVTIALKSCKSCPYAEQDEWSVSCAHPRSGPGGVTIFADEEYDLEKKFGKSHADFPPFCPLPDLEVQ